MRRRKRVLSRLLVSVLCLLYAAVWCYAGLFGETTIFGRTALWARVGDVLFGLLLLSGAFIWAARAVRIERRHMQDERKEKEDRL